MAYDGLVQTALQSAQLELDYERLLRRTERIYDEERARTLRVRLLLQEDASDELREISEEHEDALIQSDISGKELQDRLADIEEQYERTQIELKSCMRDIDQYQAEINALNASSSDSAKILTEKLTIARELSSLKPELDHLRAQISRHDNILADKLSLQRELATVQLELESEKRTVTRLKQRSQSVDPAMTEELEELKKSLAAERKTVAKLERQNTKRVNEQSAADAALVEELDSLKTEFESARRRAQDAEKRVREAENKQAISSSTESTLLDELKMDLTKERKTTQRLEREQLKKATEWDIQKESLESKLEAFRTRLRTTKEQLKEAQDELETREAARYAESVAATKARMRGASVEPSIRAATTGAVPANLKKRPVARFDPDMTIGTPGNGAHVGKKQRLTGSMLGDKSTFSITPFLNRTAMSVLPESPEEQSRDKDEHDKIDEEINTSINELAEEAEREEAQGTKRRREDSVPATKKTVEKKDTAKPTATTSADKMAKTTKAKVTVKKTKLADVPEDVKIQESIEQDQENITATTNKTTEALTSTSDITNTTLGQPKKKKLLGARRTIFDDEDDNSNALGKKKATLGFGIGKVKLGAGGKKPRTLAVFSPLKKDRRVNETVVM